MKRRILSMFLAILLVASMTVTAFAASVQDDIAYSDKVYTVYARCDKKSATANIRTTETSVALYVSCVATDNLGGTVLGSNSGISEAIANAYPGGNRTLVDLTANYYVSGNLIASKFVTAG